MGDLIARNMKSERIQYIVLLSFMSGKPLVDKFD